MGTSNSDIDATAEIDVDGTVFRFPTGSRLSIHSLDELSKFPINPNDGLEIQPAAIGSVPDQHVWIEPN